MHVEKVLKLWKIKVDVDHDHPDYPKDYVVRAVDGMDARIMAFIMDDALENNFDDMRITDAYVELCKDYTEIVAHS